MQPRAAYKQQASKMSPNANSLPSAGVVKVIIVSKKLILRCGMTEVSTFVCV
jgi:hypothetical protein